MSDGCTRAVEVCTSTRGVNGVRCVSPPCIVTTDQRRRDTGRFTVEEPADAGASMSLGLVGVVALVISDSAGGAGVRCRPSGTIWSVGRNETLTGDDGFASTALVVAVAAEAFAVIGSTASAALGGVREPDAAASSGNVAAKHATHARARASPASWRIQNPLDEHAPQNTRPHSRQWCLRRHSVNGSLQRMHRAARLSGTQTGA